MGSHVQSTFKSDLLLLNTRERNLLRAFGVRSADAGGGAGVGGPAVSAVATLGQVEATCASTESILNYFGDESVDKCLSRLATTAILRDHLDGAMARLQTLILAHTASESATSASPSTATARASVAPKSGSGANAASAAGSGAGSSSVCGQTLSRLPSFLSLMDRILSWHRQAKSKPTATGMASIPPGSPVGKVSAPKPPGELRPASPRLDPLPVRSSVAVTPASVKDFLSSNRQLVAEVLQSDKAIQAWIAPCLPLAPARHGALESIGRPSLPASSSQGPQPSGVSVASLPGSESGSASGLGSASGPASGSTSVSASAPPLASTSTPLVVHQEVHALRSQVKSLETQLAEASASAKSTALQLQEAQSAIQQSESELREVLRQNETLNVRAKEANAAASALREEMASSSADSANAVRRLQEEVASLTTALAAAKEELETSRSMHADTVQHMQAQIETLDRACMHENASPSFHSHGDGAGSADPPMLASNAGETAGSGGVGVAEKRLPGQRSASDIAKPAAGVENPATGCPGRREALADLFADSLPVSGAESHLRPCERCRGSGKSSAVPSSPLPTSCAPSDLGPNASVGLLQQQLESLEKELNAVHMLATTRHEEVTAMEQKIISLEAQVADMGALQARVNELESALASAEAKGQSALSSFQSAAEKLKDSQATLVALEAANHKLVERQKNLEARVDQAERAASHARSIRELESLVSSATQANEQLSADMAKAREAQAQAESDKAGLEAQVKATESQLEQLRSRMVKSGGGDTFEEVMEMELAAMRDAYEARLAAIRRQMSAMARQLRDEMVASGRDKSEAIRSLWKDVQRHGGTVS